MPERRSASGLARLHSVARSVQRRARTRITIHTGTTTRRQPTMRRHQLIIRRREAVGTHITDAITHANPAELEIANSRCGRHQTGGFTHASYWSGWNDLRWDFGSEPICSICAVQPERD